MDSGVSSTPWRDRRTSPRRAAISGSSYRDVHACSSSSSCLLARDTWGRPRRHQRPPATNAVREHACRFRDLQSNCDGSTATTIGHRARHRQKRRLPSARCSPPDPFLYSREVLGSAIDAFERPRFILKERPSIWEPPAINARRSTTSVRTASCRSGDSANANRC